MTNQILGYTPIKVTSNVSFIPNFKTADLLKEELRTHRLQRDHKRRLKTMQKHFRKQLPTLHNFDFIRVTKTISGTVNGEMVIVDAGIDLANGNTRREDISQGIKKNENDWPETVAVIVYDVDNFKDYKNIYYSFDSQDAVEATSHKIFGACYALGLVLNSTTGRSGAFGSALSIAYPGDRKDDILVKVAYFKDEIIELDSIGLFNPKEPSLKSQCLIAAGLMALKYYRVPVDKKTRIIGGLARLANAKQNALDHSDPKYWYGLDCIEHEFLTNPGKWISKELHRKTSYSALEPQMNFFWYCIENYMNGTRIGKLNGVKTKMFKGKYEKYRNALLATQPIIGYEFSEEEDEDE